MNIMFKTESKDYISILNASSISADDKAYHISGGCDIRNGIKTPMVVRINDSEAFNAYDIELKTYGTLKLTCDMGIADVNN